MPRRTRTLRARSAVEAVGDDLVVGVVVGGCIGAHGTRFQGVRGHRGSLTCLFLMVVHETAFVLSDTALLGTQTRPLELGRCEGAH
jgi:hypothetical protein